MGALPEVFVVIYAENRSYDNFYACHYRKSAI
jgi:phospholipase C